MSTKLLGGVAALISVLATGAAAQTSLVYNNSFPKSDTQTGVIADVWIDRINQATSGRVRVRHVAGGALLKAEGTLEGVRRGVADMGAVSIVYHIGELPISAALAGSFDVEYGNKVDLVGINAITYKLYQEFPEFQKEYADMGVKPLLFLPAGQYSLIGTANIAKVSDFKNKKVRAFGTSLPTFIESIGGVPMSIAFGELYTSLQTGVIDALITNPTAMVPSKFHEVSKFAITTGPGFGTSMAGATMAYVINLNSWNKIPETDRKIVDRVSAMMGPIGAHIMTEGTAQAYADLQKAGVKVNHLSMNDVAEIKKTSPDFFKREEERLTARGIPGTKLFARYRELADAYASGEWRPGGF